MLESCGFAGPVMLAAAPAWLTGLWGVVLMLLGFSVVVFFHELGHFVMAKLVGVRVDRFAIGFGPRLIGWRRGVGVTLGAEPADMEQRAREAAEVADGKPAIGETDYSLRALPLGGYVKMLGQSDFDVDKEGEWQVSDDPKAFTNKTVGQRMLVVSAGVIMNLVFAAGVFMVVYMIGRETPPATVGEVIPGSPADRAGLRTGDRILSVDGKPIQTFIDLSFAVMLSDKGEQLTLDVERDGQRLPEPILVTPKSGADRNLPQIGMSPPLSQRVVATAVGPEQPGEVQAMDRLVQIGELDIPDAGGLRFWPIQDARGQPVRVRVERPRDPSDYQDSPVDRVDCYVRAVLGFYSSTPTPGKVSNPDLLGLVPRVVIGGEIASGTPASKALPWGPYDAEMGLKAGDVIVYWKDRADPPLSYCMESTRQSDEQDVVVEVLRPSVLPEVEASQPATQPRFRYQRRRYLVRPERAFSWLGRPPARIGAPLNRIDEDHLVIADVVEDTPAAALDIPPGTTILAIDDAAVPPAGAWVWLIEQFLERAGREIDVRCRLPDGTEVVRRMTVPDSLSTGMVDAQGQPILLPPSAWLLSIDGVASLRRTRTSTQPADSSRRDTHAVSYWEAAREVLADPARRGRRIEVTWVHARQVHTGYFTPTEDNTDPWFQRVRYLVPFASGPYGKTFRTSNPFKALWWGVKDTYQLVLSVYQSMQRMIEGRVGVEHVSGPVGILKQGGDIARQGATQFMWFLAFISANLAVINFLPLPIVDGGLMVFLIIEKIKGRPVSLKTQVVTQVIGLALLITAFVLVTIQDILK